MVHGGIRPVVELAHQHRGFGCTDLLRLGDGAPHAPGSGGEHQFGTEGTQYGPPFPAHRVRHGQDDAIAAGGAHHGQRDAGIAAGGLDDGAAGGELARGLGSIDHGQRDAILYRIAWVCGLQLDQHRGGGVAGYPVEPHQGSATDGFGDIRVGGHVPGNVAAPVAIPCPRG